MLAGCCEYSIFISKGGNKNTRIIRSIVSVMTDRVNLSLINFGYLSTDDCLKGNDNALQEQEQETERFFTLSLLCTTV